MIMIHQRGEEGYAQQNNDTSSQLIKTIYIYLQSQVIGSKQSNYG